MAKRSLKKIDKMYVLTNSEGDSYACPFMERSMTSEVRSTTAISSAQQTPTQITTKEQSVCGSWCALFSILQLPEDKKVEVALGCSNLQPFDISEDE